MALISLMYLCEAEESISSDELEKIIKSSNVHNSTLNVTSFMILIDEIIIQIIEGEEKNVEEIYTRMKSNIHLCNFIEVFRKEIDERMYDKWSLGYLFAKPEEIEEVDGFKGLVDKENKKIFKKDFINKLCKSPEDLSHRLLKYFYMQKTEQNQEEKDEKLAGENNEDKSSSNIDTRAKEYNKDHNRDHNIERSKENIEKLFKLK